MAKAGSAKAKPRAAPAQIARASLTERRPARGGEQPDLRPPVRNIPSELAVLLGEIERLQSELSASRTRVQELEATADIDPLTGVFNRRGFERELKRSLAYVKRYGTRAALFYLDLDGFKPVNDLYGHAAGDAVLKATAAMLTRNVRASDTVARLGGDEFALILWNLNETDAATKAWALEAAVAEAGIEWQAETLSVGASIGFAMLGVSDDMAEVLAAADRAMYARKGQRKGYRAAATSR